MHLITVYKKLLLIIVNGGNFEKCCCEMLLNYSALLSPLYFHVCLFCIFIAFSEKQQCHDNERKYIKFIVGNISLKSNEDDTKKGYYIPKTAIKQPTVFPAFWERRPWFTVTSQFGLQVKINHSNASLLCSGPLNGLLKGCYGTLLT